jgi:hypothetical protein
VGKKGAGGIRRLLKLKRVLQAAHLAAGREQAGRRQRRLRKQA